MFFEPLILCIHPIFDKWPSDVGQSSEDSQERYIHDIVMFIHHLVPTEHFQEVFGIATFPVEDSRHNACHSTRRRVLSRCYGTGFY